MGCIGESLVKKWKNIQSIWPAIRAETKASKMLIKTLILHSVFYVYSSYWSKTRNVDHLFLYVYANSFTDSICHNSFKIKLPEIIWNDNIQGGSLILSSAHLLYHSHLFLKAKQWWHLGIFSWIFSAWPDWLFRCLSTLIWVLFSGPLCLHADLSETRAGHKLALKYITHNSMGGGCSRTLKYNSDTGPVNGWPL